MEQRELRCASQPSYGQRRKAHRVRTTAVHLLVALAVTACTTTNRSEQARTPQALEPSWPAAGDAAEATIRARMQGHEKLAEAMRDAVARGDLDEGKGDAKLLAALRMRGPRGELWREKADAMKAAAARIASATDLRDASMGVAALAGKCGGCHTMFGRAAIIVGQAGARATAGRAYMERHQWASERLWDGLAVPSDEAWRAGALVLSEARLAPGGLAPVESQVARVCELAQTVHDLGRKAVTVQPVDARADLYGQVLASCDECHQWLGGGPDARRSP